MERCTVSPLVLDVLVLRRARHRKPGLGLGEPGMTCGVPLHWRAAAVSAEAVLQHILPDRVADALAWDRNVLHSNFVAVIDGRRAAQCQQQHRSNAGLRSADATRDARPVVIAEHPVWPATGWQR